MQHGHTEQRIYKMIDRLPHSTLPSVHSFRMNLCARSTAATLPRAISIYCLPYFEHSERLRD